MLAAIDDGILYLRESEDSQAHNQGPTMSTQYGKSFFADRRALTVASAERVLEILWEHVQPQSVLDAGCATGIWLAACKMRGATTVCGIDGSWMPLEQLEIEASEFSEHDFGKSMPSETGNFDMALCIELAEHLSVSAGRELIDFLTAHTDLVLFSAAVPGQGGTGHINERVQSYWHELFSGRDFVCFDIIRPAIWEDGRVNVIYRQNMLLYARSGSEAYRALATNAAVSSKISSSYELDRVHPDLFAMRSKKTKLRTSKRIKNRLR